MANAGFLRAACAVTMLMAMPAFAQSNTQTGSTGPGGTVKAPTMHEPMQGGPHSADSSDNMTPKSGGGMMHHATEGHPMHHDGMRMHAGMHSSKMDAAQNGSAERLNERSFEAARKGESYTVPQSSPDSGMNGSGGSDHGGAMGSTDHGKM